MSAIDIGLIALIFLVLVGFLVALIFFGASVAGQVSDSGTKIQVALQQAFVTFEALVNNVVTSIRDFSALAVHSLGVFAGKALNVFASVGVFFRDQVTSMVEQFTSQVLDTVGFLARTIVKALSTVAGAVADVLNQVINWAGGVITSVANLIARAFAFVSQLISALIRIIVQGVVFAISFLIDEIKSLIIELSADVTILIQDILNEITVLEGFINTGLAELMSLLNTVENAILVTLPDKLNDAFSQVLKAVTGVFDGFMCGVLAPLCSLLPSFIAPSSLCDAIRNAGGCG